MTNVIQMKDKDFLLSIMGSSEYKKAQEEQTKFYKGSLDCVSLNDNKEIIGQLFKANHDKLKEALKPGYGD